jgi:demethylmenaquinone methyltransferase/2-methoxy-6-polyprenyl-1,4-benzoquinol methylase
MSNLRPEYSRYDSPTHPLAADKEAYVEGLFDAIAPSYDRANRILSFGLDRRWRRRLVREAAVPAGGRVLDVGCGTGDLLLDFARSVPNLDGEGVDFSAGMLTRARAKAPALRWVQGSALALPQASDSFDAVVSAWVLRSITDPRRFFAEMARVVRPEGRVLVLELTRPTKLWQRLLYAPVLNVYVPVLGRLLSGHANGYRYLRDSIKGFYDASAVLGFMREAGLKKLQAEPLTLGAATLFMGTK